MTQAHQARECDRDPRRANGITASGTMRRTNSGRLAASFRWSAVLVRAQLQSVDAGDRPCADGVGVGAEACMETAFGDVLFAADEKVDPVASVAAGHGDGMRAGPFD
ncbi:hypothetical protein WR25_16205 [Diploscapter pachys]|uniref:Uncharacterized protein n=1 Tax=Diploscapter pachys TaxID=2018661 RepID=A0A2A2JWH4_9BILA|nr:hypothetical protein WR25_16205 [Diploscapter pachys]